MNCSEKMMSLSRDSTEEKSTIQYSSQIDILRTRLKSRIFLGRYVERRLVNESIGYKDIVLVSNAEAELIKDLLDALGILRLLYRDHWVGITSGEMFGYPNSACLWTEIDNEPLGPFWFQIKSLKVRSNEVLMSLKCLRHISDAYLEIEPILTKGLKKVLDENKMHNISVEEMKRNFKGVLTLSNCKEFFTIFFAFIIAVFTGGTSFIAYLGNFVLALISEVSNLTKNSTPIFLGILDLIGKVVGGFYILMAMIFRPNNSAPLRYNNRKRITNYPTLRNYEEYDPMCID